MKIIYMFSSVIVFAQIGSSSVKNRIPVDQQEQKVSEIVSKELVNTNDSLVQSNIELAQDAANKIEKLEKENKELKAKLKGKKK